MLEVRGAVVKKTEECQRDMVTAVRAPLEHVTATHCSSEKKA